MSHYRMPILDETGYVVLDSFGGVMDSVEWLSLEYVDWKSSGDTRFAPIASAQGQIERRHRARMSDAVASSNCSQTPTPTASTTRTSTTTTV